MFQRRYALWLSLGLLVLALVAAQCAVAPAQQPAAEQEAEEAAAPAEQEAEAEEAPAEAAEEGAALEDELEVFSWWTSGGEAAALEALFNTYQGEHPDVEIINATVAGGTGTNARAVLATRLSGGDVPDSWQALAGVGFKAQYIATEYAAPLTEMYEEQGWFDVYPQLLLDMVSDAEGNPYLVPVNIHRGNELWYNKPLVEENGVEIGETMSFEQFFEYADTLQAAGVTPLCVGDSGIWTQAHLFEDVLAGTLGSAEKWNELWNGTVPFDDPDVKQAMETYGRMLDYINDDHSALSWDQAVEKVIEGQCAFTIMGDWSYGEFLNAGLEDNVDFGWVSTPGTHDLFLVVSDGFTLGAGSPPHPNAAREWLRVVGSTEAQEAFNPIKGSICARTDCDPEVFGEYLQWSIDRSQTGDLIPSVVHGAAAPPDFQQALLDAITLFVQSRDADAFADALVAGAEMANLGQ